MIKIYELVIILCNNNYIFIDDFILFFLKFLIYNNIVLLNFEKWGFLKFFCKIKNNNKGFFLFFRFYSNVLFLKKILNYLKTNNLVIRFFLLLVKKNSYSLNFNSFKKVWKNENFKKKNKKKN